MKIVLIAMIWLLNGATDSRYKEFSDIASCEAAKPAIAEGIKEYNAGADPNKITHMTLVCAPIEKAPQGKDV